MLATGAAPGGFHSLALTAGGALFSWGYGGFGRLGHGDEWIQLRPKRVEALSKEQVVSVSAGGAHSLALTAGGALYSCGYGIGGQLGHGDVEIGDVVERVSSVVNLALHVEALS